MARAQATWLPKTEKLLWGFTGETFPPGIHMCYIYNDEDERKRMIFRFLESGLLDGEQVSYFMDINTRDEIKKYQSVLGLEKLLEEQQGHLCLATTRETYFPDGILVPDEMLDRLGEFYTQSINEGCTDDRGNVLGSRRHTGFIPPYGV